MNTPAGFSLDGGSVRDIDPVAALLNAAVFSETLHMTLAAYAATGLLVAGVHAVLMLKDRANPFHRRALAIVLAVGGVASLLQPLSGHYAARVVARTQPVKLASLEGQFQTMRWAPCGLEDCPTRKRRPRAMPLRFPADSASWPTAIPTPRSPASIVFRPRTGRPCGVVHIAFQVMVGCGMVMAGVSFWAAILAWRSGKVPDEPVLLRALALVSPLGMVAIEAGWIVTEVGRQPWIVQNVMRTAEAVTPVPGLWISLVAYTSLYMMLGLVVVVLLLYQFRASPRPEDLTAAAWHEDH